MIFKMGQPIMERTRQFVFGPKKTFGPIGLIVNENNNKKAHAIWVECELPCHPLRYMCHVIVHVAIFCSICYDEFHSVIASMTGELLSLYQ
jgi:hypothetical protein